MTGQQRQSADDQTVNYLTLLDKRVRWLSAWMVHHANHLRPARDKVKVGGHQASSASLASVLTTLYFDILRPEDRVAVKPHASPVFHAIQYLLGQQDVEQLKRFRALGGAQSYPSRTKDQDDVDFSTGSVGLGVAITSFASMVQDYLLAKSWLSEEQTGRMIALMGDAELDEGNIYEAMLEGAKYGLRNTWWIIDYNRQSLDAVTPLGMSRRYEAMFEATDWTVHTLKFGKKLEAAFAKPGGAALRDWIENCPNDLYSALTYKGAKAWRERLLADLGDGADVAALLAGYDDEALEDLMLNLAGHDLALLQETFQGITDDRPHCFIIYTIKGYGLPFKGHKDNHAGLMNPAQMAEFRALNGIADGEEWDRFAGLDETTATALQAFLDEVPFKESGPRRHQAARFDVPADFPCPGGAEQATQVAFGKILNDLGRTDSALADHIVTTSPDVTTSTNLGGWVNQRGLFNRESREDVFKREAVVSPQRWAGTKNGQHLELGIAENNLFLALGALGLSHSLFGTRLLPLGTLYDPFINRGLDALNYACYQDARFMLVATPSGLTLAPEGGAHQSIHTPLIGMAQPNLRSYEPAFVDELSHIMRFGFSHMQAEDGGSVYLRLSTRPIAQPERVTDAQWQQDVIDGGYWLVEPSPGADLAIVYQGAVAPEALAAFEAIREDVPGAGLLAVTSLDVLHQEWSAEIRAQRAGGYVPKSHIRRLLGRLSPDAGLVTVMDGAPAGLSWLGAVCGHRVAPLGVDRFGQSGDVTDLYQTYGLDEDAILDAAASILLAR
ncbi:pyruvate dehydrogenase E1 component [Iodidimonas muriae]|uniref:Pyruvate dehydrogenase E1 component n=1 Tax=Iodidimonas muriae TaxID=261467 RepID=A0ABQ2LCM8_9PROT|nr:transketolase [Iodidimonas muriae]GER07385.1 pyruvate dehydrogenase E1 component [Kordiimonadales bacterium JCM 17843]GGO10742.1 pyruvate dehydrogenase E1 component [Iodidimonas muriae]